MRLRQYVIRDTGSAVVFWIAAVVLTIILVNTVVTGDWSFLGAALPFGLFALWAVWMGLFHPHVRYDANRAIVVNLGRVHELPWARVSAVRQRLNLTFELEDGSSISAAGATAPRGMGTIVGGITGRLADTAAEFSRNAAPLDALRASAAPTGDPVVSRWDVVPLAIGAVLFVAAVVDLAIILS